MQDQQCIHHVIRLLPEEDLKRSLEKYCRTESITAGWIATCVGSLTHTHLRFANHEVGSRQQGYFEILSLSGTVSSNGVHLHVCVADQEGRTFGGHLLDGNLVYTTAEVVIGELPNLVFSREKDGSTSWPELQIRGR